MQSDKLIVSKLFSLKILGCYSLASMFGAGLSMLVTSVFNTIFPRFSALAAGNEDELRFLYHRSTQLIAVIVFPVATVLALFSTKILLLWTRNTEVAHIAAPIMVFLVIGSALNGLSNPPYALQLAYGWTNISLRINILLVCIGVPATWLLAKHYGPVGAACVWPGLNAIYIMAAVPLTHRRLLKGGTWRWYAETSLPLMAILPIAFLGKLVVAGSMSAAATICILLALLICSTTAAALISPSIRSWLFDQTIREKIY
jgi:O-antigen/teichoic acid export membrane protein